MEVQEAFQEGWRSAAHAQKESSPRSRLEWTGTSEEERESAGRKERKRKATLEELQMVNILQNPSPPREHVDNISTSDVGWQGCSSGFSPGSAIRKSLGAALQDLEKGCPSLLCYLD